MPLQARSTSFTFVQSSFDSCRTAHWPNERIAKRKGAQQRERDRRRASETKKGDEKGRENAVLCSVQLYSVRSLVWTLGLGACASIGPRRAGVRMRARAKPNASRTMERRRRAARTEIPNPSPIHSDYAYVHRCRYQTVNSRSKLIIIIIVTVIGMLSAVRILLRYQCTIWSFAKTICK